MTCNPEKTFHSSKASSEVLIFDEFAGSYRSVYESTDMQQKTNINSKEWIKCIN